MAATFKSQTLKLKRIFNDKSRNPRMVENYDTDPITGFDPENNRANLYEMINIDGIKVPPAVSKLSPARKAKLLAEKNVDADAITIWGHRRLDVAMKIHAADPKRFETVECLVYEGLSEADEIRMLMDHEGVKGLNEYELFSAILSLKLNTSMSEEHIATQVGKSRGYVQRRLWIASLPDVVECNYRLKFERDSEGKPMPFVNLTDKALAALNKAANIDRADTLEHPAVDPSDPASEFYKVWNNLVRDGEIRGETVKAKNRQQILDGLQYVQDPVLKIVMMWCAGDQVKLTDARDSMKIIRAKAGMVAPEPEPVQEPEEEQDTDETDGPSDAGTDTTE